MTDGTTPESGGKISIGHPPTANQTGKVDVESLRLRDRLVFQTASSTYTLIVGKDLHCILVSSNKSARGGQVILRGGTNADTTEYTPNRVFVGGRLAYAFEEDSSSLVTTPVIDSIVYEPGLR